MPPPSAGRKEGQEGHGPVTRQFGEPLSRGSGFTELCPEGLRLVLLGARGGDTPTSGQASKALLHVTVGGWGSVTFSRG